MYKIKLISLVVLFSLFSLTAQAQESEGLVQKAYKKFILKEKTVEKEPALKSQKTSTVNEVIGEDVKTMVYDSGYKDMPKSKIIQEIKDELDSEEDILVQIPQLKRQKGRDGIYVYSYLVDGKQVNLDDIDENVLRSLIEQVSAKAEKLTADAILEQREELRNIRHAATIVRPPEAPPRHPSANQRPPELPRR